MPFTRSWRFNTLALWLKRSTNPGKKSSPVICPGACRASVIVCPPVPHPKSAIREWSVRWSIKLNALSVTSGLPGPCRSVFKKNSQIKLTSIPRMVLFSLLMIDQYKAYTWKHNSTFLVVHGLKIQIIIIEKSPPERAFRKQAKGQPVSEIQIVYYTKSDCNLVFNMM